MEHTCTFPSVSVAGKYELTPTLNGVPLKNTPIQIVVKPGALSFDDTEIQMPEESFEGLNGPKVILKDKRKNLLLGGGESVTAEILPLGISEVPAVDKGDGSYDLIYPLHFEGDFQFTIAVNGEDSKVGPFDVSIQKIPVPDQMKSKCKAMFPGSGSILAKILEDASEEERKLILEEILSK